jgi:hypothetical protein
MKTRSAFLGIVAALALTAAQAEDKKPEWKEFKSDAGRFNILMPGTPKQSKRDVANNVAQYQFLVDGGDRAWVVGYQDDPNFTKADDAVVKLAFTGAKNALLKNLKGKQVSDKEIKLGPNLGTEFQMEISIGLYRTRMYMVKERLYQITIVAPKAVALSEESDRFFDSFKLPTK